MIVFPSYHKGIILQKKNIHEVSGFEPGTMGSKEQHAPMALPGHLVEKSANQILRKDSLSPAIPMQNHVANSPCKIGLTPGFMILVPSKFHKNTNFSKNK